MSVDRCRRRRFRGAGKEGSRTFGEQMKIKKRVTFHTARHTFATQLLSKGVPITTVQALLGHSSVRTTQVYAEVKLCTILNDLQRVLR